MRVSFVLLGIFGMLLPKLAAQDIAHFWLAPSALQLQDIPCRVLPPVDNEALYVEEMAFRRAGRPPQFAHAQEVDVRPAQSGIWEVLPDGRQVWRYWVTSPGAYSLNLGFERYALPEGAILMIYDPEKTSVLGPFSPADNELHNTLWTPIIAGDALIVELQLPAHIKSRTVDLQLRYVNHDFAGVTKTLSGSCNVDVLCGAADGFPQVDAFRDVIRSVATFTVSGKYHCTGFLINNTAGDCRPYFVTARHCEVDSAQAASVVIYWNYQHSTCRTVGSSANSRPGNGSLNVFNTGTIFRAAWTPSDMTLLELDDPIRPDANAFFAGWNIDTLLPQQGVASIHHASSEEKRFTFSRQPVYRGAWGKGALRIPNGDHLIIPFWDMGVTEDGSSGGPLFNMQQQAIGQLHGGAAACGNQAFDAFGWIGASWEGGGTPKTRLRDWLDPLHTGQKSIDGKEEARCHKTIAADTVYRKLCAGGTAVFALKTSGFSKAVYFSAPRVSDSLLFSFDKNPVESGALVHLSVFAVRGAPTSRYPITVKAVDGQDTVFVQLIVDVRNTPSVTRQVSPTNGAVQVSIHPVLHWASIPGADSFRVVVATDPDFKFPLKSVVLRDTLLALDTLGYEATYYWNVQGLNNCGVGEAASFSFTTTPDWRLEVQGVLAEACNTGTYPFRFFVGSGFKPPLQVEYAVRNAPSVPIRLVVDSLIAPGFWTGAILEDLSSLTFGSYILDVTVRDAVKEARASTSLGIKTQPTPPILALPGMDTAYLKDQPTLSWKPSPGATAYTLELSRTPDFAKLEQGYAVGSSLRKQLTPLSSGAFYWRVISENTCGTAVSDARRFSVHTGNISAMNTLLVAVDPNPTDGLLRVLISDPVNEFAMDLYAINGQHLQHIEATPFQTSWTLDLSGYPNGVYFLRLYHRLTSLSRRIVLHR